MRNLFGYQRGGPVGRYGEPGRPSLAPRKTIPRTTKDPRRIKEAMDRMSAWPVPTEIDAPVVPTTPKTISPTHQTFMTKGFDPVTSYADVPYDQGWWALVNLRRDLTPQQMHEVYMKHGHPQYSQNMGTMGMSGIPDALGGGALPPMPNPNYDPTYVKPTRTPETDPVQTAVDQTTGGNLAQEIMAYLGGDQAGVYREDYDIDGDGEISLRDSIYQLQVQEGKRNPDGTPVTEADPVQTAVDQATGGYTAQDILSHIGSEGEYREDYDLNKDGAIDVLDSVWQLQVEGGLRDPETFEAIAQPDPVTPTAPVFPTETEPGMGTVGPAGTTIDPIQAAVDAAVNEYVSPQDQFLADYPDWATNQPTLPATPDPVQDAVDTAVGGGGIDDMPIGSSVMTEYYNPATGETTWTSNSAQTPPEGFIPVPKGGIPQTDPVQDAVDAATGTKPLPSSYGAVDNWGEPGYTAYDPADQFIDPVTSFVEDPVSPLMDEDPLNDAWTAPVADVLSTAGAGAGGDPRTDFAVVNDLTEPTTGDPYSVGVIDPNATDPVTGVDPNAPGPDPVYYDEDIETYVPPVDTTGAVDDMTTTTGVGDMPTTNVAGDMTTTTGGFPDILFEGQIYTDADGVSWISVLGEWREVGPTGGTGTGTGTGDTGTGGFPANPFETMVHIDANGVTWTFTQGQWVEVTPTGTGTGDTGTGDTGTGDTGTGDTGTGDTGTGDTGTGQSEVDKLNALIAELRAEQEAERAAWEAQTAAATGKYTLTGPSIGYNPYVSGQYQSDPYGAAGVPDLGGITTIPVPDAWQPPTLQPWQAPAPPAQALASWLKPMAQQTQPSNTWGR